MSGSCGRARHREMYIVRLEAALRENTAATHEVFHGVAGGPPKVDWRECTLLNCVVAKRALESGTSNTGTPESRDVEHTCR